MSIDKQLKDLETALAKNTEALTALAAALANGTAPATKTTGDAKTDEPKAKPQHFVCKHCGAYAHVPEEPTECECGSPGWEKHSSKKAADAAIKKAKESKTADETKKEIPDRKKVAEIAKDALGTLGKDGVKKLIKEAGGADKLRDVADDKLADLVVAIDKAVAEVNKADEDEDL